LSSSGIPSEGEEVRGSVQKNVFLLSALLPMYMTICFCSVNYLYMFDDVASVIILCVLVLCG